jgi:hypothetical protein
MLLPLLLLLLLLLLAVLFLLMLRTSRRTWTASLGSSLQREMACRCRWVAWLSS